MSLQEAIQGEFQEEAKLLLDNGAKIFENGTVRQQSKWNFFLALRHAFCYLLGHSCCFRLATQVRLDAFMM